MKCAVCGREFGTGHVCQYCEADKFTALGNYEGYNVPTDTFTNNGTSFEAYQPKSTVGQSSMFQAKTMICYACAEIIPADSVYCPQCSRQLFVDCPNCGQRCSTQYPACNACGTNRAEYWEEKRKKREERAKKEQEQIEKDRKEGELIHEARDIYDECCYIPPAILKNENLFAVSFFFSFLLACILMFLWVEGSANYFEALLKAFICGLSSILLHFLFWRSLDKFFSYKTRYKTRKNIKRWIKEHPNHRAIPYLEFWSLAYNS